MSEYPELDEDLPFEEGAEVRLHAFTRIPREGEEGEYDETYTDDPEETVGWSVYVRIPDPAEEGQFDVQGERDFETRAEARRYASQLCREWSALGIKEY